ncbi:MAG TPA: DUF1206 domain-containing protein [Candidatus Corynebacterium gallistercoris]|uniref:DUF1206 domain-containing protein n=1 Tax=Candidatus Corynebacterium gallistercoris TaxID=2838530 RepID=A0A9D1RXA1_9CORY|nr:DUF1206 domain-containing protein [Candidatus Corynebacterium gallistercoris]
MKTTSEHASKAANHPALVTLARAGFVTSGLLHILIGWIAVRVATGSTDGGGEEASNSGALAQIAETPGGQVLLWVMVAGLAGLGLWRLTTIFIAQEAKDKARGAILGVIMFSLAFTTSTFARGQKSSDSGKAKDVTGDVLAMPFGKWAVIIAGLVVIGVGAYGIYKGATRKFKEELEAGTTSGNVGTAIVAIGTFGYVARGVAFGTLGVLIVQAALTNDPEKAGGLDAALRTLSAQPYGMALLILVGLGFAAYGVYSIARARYAEEI